MTTQQLPERERQIDAISRERWSLAAAAIMCQVWDRTTLATVVATGYDEFRRVAKPILAGHCFHDEDFRRMFAYLRHRVESQSYDR